MPAPQKKVALIEPFYGGSHKRWADELKRHSQHQIDLFTLPGRHWKWRMHGASVTLANKLLSQETNYDLILATDMLDLAVFLGLIRRRYANTPVALYFHENQLCYPWSPRDKDAKTKKDLHYAFINFTSALSADRVYFNSNYHRDAYLAALPSFLDRYPDHRNKSAIQTISDKSQALPLALDLSAFDPYRPEKKENRDSPLLLWNHRWEYDKNPKGFCKLLYRLAEREIDFQVAMLGERFEEEPEYFAKVREKLGSRIVTYGHVESFSEYADWLWRADILPVTSVQDFFGGSVVEAIYCGCHPILPNRLAYPDHVDPRQYPDNYYTNIEEAVSKTERLIRSDHWKKSFPLSVEMARYDWRNAIASYDHELKLDAR